MDEPIDQGFHIDQIGSEKKLEQDSAERSGKEKEEGEIVAEDGDVKGSFREQSPRKQKDDRSRNKIPRIKAHGLNGFDPRRHRIEKVSQVPEQHQSQ